MNNTMIWKLVKKDWSFLRRSVLAYILGGCGACIMLGSGSEQLFYAGSVLLITILISLGVHLAIMTVVQERSEKTLLFVLSLPVSIMEYTSAKLLANMLIFLAVWSTLLCAVLLVIQNSAALPAGLMPLALILVGEILVAYCLLLAVALISESQGWTIVAVVITNLFFQFFLYWVSHLPAIASHVEATTAVWSGTALGILAGELLALALILGATFWLQSKKTDFL